MLGRARTPASASPAALGSRLSGGSVVEVDGYSVLIGRGLLGEVPELVGGAAQVAVLFAGPVRAHAERSWPALRGAGLTVLPIEVPDAEAGKDIDVAARCWDALGAAAFTRTDAVVGVGGGAVTDLAGFVAACWLRGVRLVPVPTSLLGMVDAAVGGKTGINTAAGKNLVGAFHPPAGVAVRPVHPGHPARRRPARRHGRGGQVRLHRRPGHPRPRRGRPGRGRSTRAARCCRELVERAVAVKARVVADDLRESGPARDPQLRPHAGPRHRAARAVPLAARRTRSRSAWSTPPTLGRLRRPARRGRPPTGTARAAPARAAGRRYPADAWPELLAAMRVDKKARGA